jgi:nucleoside-diphosphate-sugar epimerase
LGTVLITGAAGFIGRTLAERLREGGATVRGADFAADPELDIAAGDVGSAGPWQEQAAGCDTVIHTAAIVSNAASIGDAWRVNVLGTRNALDAAVAAGARRFVHFSSVRAFGDTGFPDGVDERWPVRPDGHTYVDTKIASEQVVLQAHAAGEIECTVIRPGDVYGPGSRPWTVLPVEAIAAGRFFLPAMGRGVHSPIFVDDLAAGVLAAARADAAAKSKPAREVPSLSPGDRVNHDSFGVGTVVTVEGVAEKSVASIDFGSEGVKRLLLRYAPVEKL